MTKKTGSFVYVFGRNSSLVTRGHYRTLNEAKEYGLGYIKKDNEVFYRFTKIPFPYLFYVSKNYVVLANYVTTDSNKIPYVAKLIDSDADAKNAMDAFEKKFDKTFYYDKDARTKSRDITKRTKNRNAIKKQEYENKKKHYNTYLK